MGIQSTQPSKAPPLKTALYCRGAEEVDRSCDTFIIDYVQSFDAKKMTDMRLYKQQLGHISKIMEKNVKHKFYCGTQMRSNVGCFKKFDKCNPMLSETVSGFQSS